MFQRHTHNRHAYLYETGIAIGFKLGNGTQLVVKTYTYNAHKVTQTFPTKQS